MFPGQKLRTSLILQLTRNVIRARPMAVVVTAVAYKILHLLTWMVMEFPKLLS